MSDEADARPTDDDLQTFLRAWLAFQEAAQRNGHGQSTELRDRVTAHLGVDPSGLQSATSTLLSSDAVNHDVALEAFDPEAELLGLNPDIGNMGRGVSLQTLFANQPFVPNEVMPITWTEHPVDVGLTRTCAVSSVALAHLDGTPVVVASWPRDKHGPPGSVGQNQFFSRDVG